MIIFIDFTIDIISVYFFPREKKNCTRAQKLKKVAVKKKSAREKRNNPSKSGRETKFVPVKIQKM